MSLIRGLIFLPGHGRHFLREKKSHQKYAQTVLIRGQFFSGAVLQRVISAPKIFYIPSKNTSLLCHR